ncbi:MAG: hypothetical protein R3B47_00980 [Bacteroidia bacterium]
MKRGANAKIPVIEEVEAVACAVQNMYLTTFALGLAGYWSSGGMTYHPAMKELFHLGEEDQCLGFLCWANRRIRSFIRRDIASRAGRRRWCGWGDPFNSCIDIRDDAFLSALEKIWLYLNWY